MTGPDRLLTWAVRLLSPQRQEWGRAMLAELAQIESGPARWRFAWGCTRVALRRPAIGVLGYPVAVVAILVGAVLLAGGMTYAPLRGGLLALVAILVAVSWLGRRPWALGPVGDDPLTRVVRTGGYLLVGLMALSTVARFYAATNNLPEKASVGVPILTTVLTLYATAFASLTGRRTAVARRALAGGAGIGTAAALAWLVAVLARPPLPTSGAAAMAVLVGATVLAGGVAMGRWRDSLLAALLAGTVTGLLIFLFVHAVLRLPRWVPDIGGSVFPASVSAAGRLAENRNYAVDPYVGVLVVGCLMAAAATVVTLATAPRSRVEFGAPAASRLRQSTLDY